MNFQQLEYIIAVDRLKHFLNAAERCNVTQATLSAMVKKLEAELDIVLFDRKKQPVVTTEQGLEIINRAKQILSLRDELLEFKKNDQNNISGRLRLGVIPTIANSLLPKILPPILANYPDLTLDIIEVTTENIMHKLKNDQLDAGILATPLNNEQYEEEILYYESMMVYGIKDRNKKYISPKNLEGKQNWLLEEGNCFRNQSITFCKLKNKALQPSNLKFEGNSFETLLNLTDQFGGYTLIPELYHQTLPLERKDKSLLFEKPFPVREVSLVHYRSYTKKRAIEAIADQIKTVMHGQLITEKLQPQDLNVIGID